MPIEMKLAMMESAKMISGLDCSCAATKRWQFSYMNTMVCPIYKS
jgi:hypothetical protein